MAVAAAAGLAVAACSSGDAETEPATIRLDDAAGLAPAVDDIQPDPDGASAAGVEFTDLNGDSRSFGAYAGSPLVINFFARSCPPCVTEMPHLQAISERYADALSVVGISLDPLRTDAEALIAETGVSYDIGWDPTGELFERFGALAMPTTVFVDANSTVAEVWSGVLTVADLEAKIEGLL